jgi:hypothetical protein
MTNGLFRLVNRDASGTIKVLVSVDLPRALRTVNFSEARLRIVFSTISREINRQEEGKYA